MNVFMVLFFFVSVMEKEVEKKKVCFVKISAYRFFLVDRFLGNFYDVVEWVKKVIEEYREE